LADAGMADSPSIRACDEFDRVWMTLSASTSGFSPLTIFSAAWNAIHRLLAAWSRVAQRDHHRQALA
jgi:hypothetical protein